MDVRQHPRGSRLRRATGRALSPAAVLLALAAAACGDSPGPTEIPPIPTTHMEVVFGADQHGLAGYALLEPVTVKIDDGRGHPGMGGVVRFEVETGGGSVLPETRTADSEGEASTSWRLGPGPGPQRLRAVLLSDTTVAVEVSATAVGPDQVDLVVVHGALAPLTGFVLVKPDGSYFDMLLARQWTDTLVYLPPVHEPDLQVVIFGTANRPLQVSPTWTTGVDTVDVTLRPPVPVNLRVDVQAGTFEEQKAVIEDQLAAAQEVWSAQGMGVVVGEVTYQDQTDPPRDVPVSSTGLCSGLQHGEQVTVKMVTSIDGGRYDGWGCWSGHIWLSLGTSRFPRLLAHELGHTFTLVHTSSGLMYPSSPGGEIREGEIYRAHFDDQSVLNTIFDSEPVELRRPCHASTPLVPICLPEDLDFARLVAVAARDLLAPAEDGAAERRDATPPGLRAADGFGR